jgi:hypothetical protein
MSRSNIDRLLARWLDVNFEAAVEEGKRVGTTKGRTNSLGLEGASPADDPPVPFRVGNELAMYAA